MDLFPGAPVPGAGAPDRARDQRRALAVLVIGVVGVVAASVALHLAFRSDAAADGSAEGAAGRPATTGRPSTTGSGGPPSTAAPGRGSRGRPLPLGSTVELDNGWRVRVVGATVGAEAARQVAAADEFNEPARVGRSYVVVTLEVTFAGRPDAAAESPFDGFDVSVAGPDGGPGEFATDEVESPAPALDLQQPLPAAGTASGVIVLTAPAVDAGPVLRLAPAGRNDLVAWVSLT